MLPLLPIEGALLDGQQDLTEDWEDELLAGNNLVLPREAVEELFGTGIDPRSVEILEVRTVLLLDCGLLEGNGNPLQIGLEQNLPASTSDTAWALLLHDPVKTRWELQGSTGVSVQDGCPFDRNDTEGEIDLLLAEVLIETTNIGTGGSGGCNTGMNPLPVVLLLILHYLRSRP